MATIFEYDFMIRAFLIGTLFATVAPVIGIFLVVRRYSYFPDTLSHVSLLGVAIGFLARVEPVLTAAATSVLAAFGIEYFRGKKIFGESVLTIFMSSSLAFATILFNLGRGFNQDLLSFLFGSITSVTPTDIWIALVITVIVAICIFYFYHPLFALSFDEETAQAKGLSVRTYNYLLLVLSALVIALAINIIGVLLIGSLMLMPVLAGMQFQKSFRFTLFVSIIFSVLSVILGLFAAFYLDLSSGGSIALMSLFFFLLSFAVNRLIHD